MGMEFFGLAGGLCLIAAAAAFIIAVIMFFTFDIPTIVKCRTGLAYKAYQYTNVLTAKKMEAAEEVPFRIVRKILITDSDETIDLREVFGEQELEWEVGNEKHKEDDDSA